jgi:Mg-chelatase subunit ChlD
MNEITRFREKSYFKKLEISSGMRLNLHKDVSKRTVYLLLDHSTSMEGTDKMRQAREGAVSFAKEAQNKGYALGLISFASYARHVLYPKREIGEIRAKLETIRADGSTNMADAIHKATDMLTDTYGEKVMCIVTDGEPDSRKEALEAVEKAKIAGIDIMTIGTDDADLEFLEKLATKKELSTKVRVEHFEQGITSMAKFLPQPSSLTERR